MGNSNHKKNKTRSTASTPNRNKKDYIVSNSITSDSSISSAKVIPSTHIPSNISIHPNFPLTVVKDQSSQTNQTSSTSSIFSKLVRFMKSTLLLIADILLLIVITYFALVVSILFSPTLQSLLIFLHYPTIPSGNLTDLAYVGLNPSFSRNIIIHTEDHLQLKGYHVVPPHFAMNCEMNDTKCDDINRDIHFNHALSYSNRIIIYFHGTGGSRAMPFRIHIIKDMANYFNASVITFDYRGFGQSEGWPSEMGVLNDSRAAIRWVEKALLPSDPSLGQDPTICQQAVCGSSPPSIYLYGHSLGTGISTMLAQEMSLHPKEYSLRLSGLLLDSAFNTMKNATLTHPLGRPFRIFPFITRLMLDNLLYTFPSEDRIAQVHCPLMLMHGLRDYKVPIVQGLTVYAKYRQQLLIRNEKCGLMSLLESRDVVRDAQFNNQVEGCDQIVRFHAMLDADHNTVGRSLAWIAAMREFFRSVERQHGGRGRRRREGGIQWKMRQQMVSEMSEWGSSLLRRRERSCEIKEGRQFRILTCNL